ncbi:preprotein translocase subunit SecE [Clostridium thermobutyricum]|uniref:Protein translocase subunit SecE n=2 Tax=Clostridium thermobutyricum TaxID=29372 RepID=N9XYX9_9CLOT|nr:preprotein translocase subunit SecE [Clostridium thermobutyricum]ENZ00787.1 preprotein translocase, SecE subunit [Clostridium thermobutyricum]OPX46719.1 protein translocase subunit SecE [Clostridium thermobutyricum DSM 4928]
MTGNKVKNAPSNKGGLISFLKGVKNEFKRIVWPSKEETKKALIAVLGFTIIYVVMVGGFDYIFQNLFEVVLKLK